MKRARKALVALGLAGLVGGCADGAGNTPVSEEFFELSLPGSWSALPTAEPDLYVWQSRQNEQISVSLHRAKEILTATEQSAMVRELANLRRRAEQEEATRDIQFIRWTEPVGWRD